MQDASAGDQPHQKKKEKKENKKMKPRPCTRRGVCQTAHNMAIWRMTIWRWDGGLVDVKRSYP